MFQRILFVCVGNICRSPTAEYVLRQRHPDPSREVASAGLAALVGHGVDPSAASVLAEHGIDAEAHRARQLDAALVAWSQLILVMEKRHVSAVTGRWPHATGRTLLLGKWIDGREVADPYRQRRAAFEHAYEVIEHAVDSWVGYL